MPDMDHRMERFAGALTGVYRPEELDHLRDEWGGYPSSGGGGDVNPSSGGGGDVNAKLDAYLTELEDRLGPILAADLAEVERWADRVLGPHHSSSSTEDDRPSI